MQSNIENRERRDFLIWTGATSAILIMQGCGPLSSSELVTTLTLVSAGIQVVLPTLSILLPPPYGTVAALIGPFLNLITGAANKTSGLLTNPVDPTGKALTAIQESSLIEGYWAGVLLDPSVLNQLPNTPISPTNPQTPRSLVSGLVGAASAFLNAIAGTLPGIVVSTPATSLIPVLQSTPVSSHALKGAFGDKPFPISHGILGVGGDMGKLRKIKKDTDSYLIKIHAHMR